MTGYQEVLTDPSYAGQIVTMTCPEIGNYGVTEDDEESRGRRWPASSCASRHRWRATGAPKGRSPTTSRATTSSPSRTSTRALTRVLRSAGVMRGVIATGPNEPAELVEKARAAPDGGSDLVLDVTCPAPFDWKGGTVDEEFQVRPERRSKRRLKIAAYDFGMKWNILRRFDAWLATSACFRRRRPPPSSSRRTRTVCSQQRARRSRRSATR